MDNSGTPVTKLATIMTKPGSWSSKAPVRGVDGTRRNLRATESERAMELPTDFTAFYADGARVAEGDRLKMVGNAWHIRTTSALLASAHGHLVDTAAMNTEDAAEGEDG